MSEDEHGTPWPSPADGQLSRCLNRLSESNPEFVHDFPNDTGRFIQRATGYRATIFNGGLAVEAAVACPDRRVLCLQLRIPLHQAQLRRKQGGHGPPSRLPPVQYPCHRTSAGDPCALRGILPNCTMGLARWTESWVHCGI